MNEKKEPFKLQGYPSLNLSDNMSVKPGENDLQFIRDNYPQLVRGLEDENTVSQTRFFMNVCRNAANLTTPKTKEVSMPADIEEIKKLNVIIKGGEWKGQIVKGLKNELAEAKQNAADPEAIQTLQGEVERLEAEKEVLQQQIDNFKPGKKLGDNDLILSFPELDPYLGVLEVLSDEYQKITGEKVEREVILWSIFTCLVDRPDKLNEVFRTKTFQIKLGNQDISAIKQAYLEANKTE